MSKVNLNTVLLLVLTCVIHFKRFIQNHLLCHFFCLQKEFSCFTKKKRKRERKQSPGQKSKSKLKRSLFENMHTLIWFVFYRGFSEQSCHGNMHFHIPALINYHHYNHSDYYYHHYQWRSGAEEETREHAATVDLITSREAHANGTKGKVEMESSQRRSGRAMRSCHVWGHSQRCLLFVLTHLHLTAPSQRRRVCASKTASCECARRKRRGQKGRGSHTLANGVSEDRTFLGDICEESKRIIFLFTPLQRYLLWHIAVLCYEHSNV